MRILIVGLILFWSKILGFRPVQNGVKWTDIYYIINYIIGNVFMPYGSKR